MTSKEIYSLVEFETGLDLKRPTRKREYVEARSVANTLARKYTKESLESIGTYAKINHATVLHSISCYENVYKIYSATALEVYTKIEQFLKTENKSYKEILNLEMLVHQLINLRQENRRLRYRLKKMETNV